ncbi:MAG TPA: CsbD family protein [Xanthobacteraceae bacterium]|nr:CsbD family protein [Xanthobacteraceae bacterium]
MDENRIAGTARNMGGKAQESVGRVLGDSKTEADGVMNQVKGAAQDLYGQARDSAAEIAGSARDTVKNSATSFEGSLRRLIETQPYTATCIALGLGWLLGRTHRPL